MGCISLVSAAPAVPESALPIGMEKEDGSTQLIPIEPSESAEKNGNSVHWFKLAVYFLILFKFLHQF